MFVSGPPKEWQAKLASIMEHFVQHGGDKLAPVLTSVLKRFSHAPHRWESGEKPRRRFCAMLGPLLVMLAVKASDIRAQPPDRQRALELLRGLTPELVVTAGLGADFGSEMMRLTRYFDTSEHDPAKLQANLVDFETRLKTLFIESHILDEVPGGDTAMQSATYLAITTAKALPPVFVGNSEFHIWPKHAKVEALACLESMQTVVDMTIARVHAELPSNGLHADLCVFDLTWYSQATSSPHTPEPMDKFKKMINGRITRLNLCPYICPLSASCYLLDSNNK